MPLANTLVLAALLAAPVAAARAQHNMGPVQGERVRVDAPALLDVPIIGRLNVFAGDSLVMQASEGHATMLLPVRYVLRVQVSEGRDRIAAALLYGAAGASAGALIGATAMNDDRLTRLAGFFAGGILGAPIGAVTGAIVAPESWRTAWNPDLAVPTTGSFRLAIDEGADVRFALRGDSSNVQRASSGGVLGDTLRLLPARGAATRDIALRDLSRLEISGGDDKRRGMLIGAGIVGGATAIFAASDASKGNISAGDAVGTVAVNAVLGALIGYAFAPRGWERLPLPAR